MLEALPDDLNLVMLVVNLHMSQLRESTGYEKEVRYRVVCWNVREGFIVLEAV